MRMTKFLIAPATTVALVGPAAATVDSDSGAPPSPSVWTKDQCVRASKTTRALGHRRLLNAKERAGFVKACVEYKWEKNWYELD
jgi:hypothetical protein